MEDEEVQDILNSSADFFANSSAETVTEGQYPPPPILESTENLILSPNSSNFLNEFVNERKNDRRISCPFCIFDFGFDYILKEHIRSCHPAELKLILYENGGKVGFYKCPFCEAKFFHKDLLPRHVMRKHELCVINMFSGFSPEKYVYCRFCPHKILKKHFKLLIIHIEKKHFQLFEKYLIDKYSVFTNHCDDIESLDVGLKNDNSPGLSFQMNKLTTEESGNSSPQFKSILKPRTAYPIEATEEVDSIMLQTEVNVVYANLEVKPTGSKKARRRLRFDIPDPSLEGCDEKENLDVTPNKKKKLNDRRNFKWLNLLKSKKGNDSLDANFLANYKCGVCSEVFNKNSKLTEHVKKMHKRLFLQAQYCCGDCDAKFYSNKFLLMHCKYHHAPLCLKSSFVKGCGNF